MGNIMKSALYDFKHNKRIYRIYVYFLIVNALIIFFNVAGEDSTEYQATFAILNNGTILYFLAIYVIAIISATLSGSNFMDKLINYEVMAGHKRGEVFFARAIISVIVSVIAGMILTIAGFLVMASFNWEDISCISSVIIRIMLFIFPFIRLSCALIFLTFLIRNSYIVIFLGCYASFFEMLPVKNRYLFSATNLSLLMKFKDGVITAISMKQAALTIAVSVIASAIYLGLGCVVFKKRDMR